MVIVFQTSKVDFPIEEVTFPVQLFAILEYAQFESANIDLSNYTEELKKTLKANIAQQLFGPYEYEIILNESDPIILKVLELEEEGHLEEN